MSTNELSDVQMLAINALLAGNTKEAAAKAAGVNRSTLFRWLQDDFDFIAHLNERRSDIHWMNVQRLRNLASEAIGVMETLLQSNSERIRLAAATSILKSVALAVVERPHGETDPEKLRADREAAEAVDRLFAISKQIG